MSILQTPGDSDATGAIAAAYAADQASLGYVPRHTRVLAMRPESFEAWKSLQSSIATSLGMRRYELVTLAAALGIGSRHCRLAHGQKTLKYIDEEKLLLIARNYQDAGLDPAEVAMMDFAVKLSTDSVHMSNADSQKLRDAGFDDSEIIDIALAAAARNYLSRVLQALAVDVDVPPALSEAMRTALLEPLTSTAKATE